MLSYKSKSKIYSSLLKHGYNAFTLDILEYCEKEELITREQYYIDKLSPSYNILKIAVRKKIKKYNFLTFFF